MQIKGIARLGFQEGGTQPTWLCASVRQQVKKTLRMMKLTAFLLLTGFLHVSANSLSQTVTYTASNTSLQQVFEAVKQQTGYVFFYKPADLQQARPVTIVARQLPLEKFMDQVLNGQQLDYFIESQTIVVRKKIVAADAAKTAGMDQQPALPQEIKGVLLHADTREPLFRATVLIKGTQTFVVTDKNGAFSIPAKAGDVLVISYVGFQSKEIKITAAQAGIIMLAPANSVLDEAVVQAYGITSRRVSTSNITKVSGKELNNAPVTNPLAALQGRVPGMVITQTSGVPGAAFKVQIRGRTQVDATYGANDEPLYIIDGVPFATGNASISRVSSAISVVGISGLSPFSTINMADIESIEVLKDADATAIYGSRGASGVILITTRKGKTGTTRFDINVNRGGSKAPLPDLLTTKEYVAMRKEAFANDNKAMTTTNAYDILLWDTTRDHNLARQLIGGTAKFTSAQASISGGANLVQYLVGGGFNQETNVYPDELPNTRGSAHFNITARSADQKFTANITGNYTSARNETVSSDLASKLMLPPNYLLYDAAGDLAWNEKGIVTDNPLAYLKQQYTAKTANLLANVTLAYKIMPDLNIRTSVGYNAVRVDEVKIMPKAAQNPANITTGTSFFGNSNFKSWIVEPQADYMVFLGKGKLNALAGGTFQYQKNDGYNFTVNGYTSDDFLGTLIGISGSNVINPSSSESEYKYLAFFGRLNYNYDNTYILNLSGRRDGSSRFGPNYRFSNFGAVGAAWVFTNERFMRNVRVLSFGKLRASYGVTGNDQIGDYKYIDAYSSNTFAPTYRDSTALIPSALYKPDLHWERNKKLEVAVELGFGQDRFLVSAAWYRNRSNDPLVLYPLSNVTGFPNIATNLNGVVVDNTGFEISLSTVNIKNQAFEWTTNFNMTIPKNKLVAFPGLEQSSYATKYIVGQSLNIGIMADHIGVDPQTGLHKIADLDTNGLFNSPADMRPLFHTDPKIYGGLQNTFRFRQFECSFLLQYHRQMSPNWLSSLLYNNPIGGMWNVPDAVSDRWQKPGDITNTQKFTTNNSAANSLLGNYASYFSDLRYSDASYIRLKNVSLSYSLPPSWLKKIKFTNARIYLLAQNLYTFTPYKGGDPETVYLTRLPPLRTVTAGVQLNF
ncbi:SusC/RagA family TonB-linked outer membrane protein [Pseudoflavitalea sp. X16]|uniref:SusC/RagA family TonB-linked outer membrane protein n=1 Tax=Paraflavitalea devenefica TaxID=2716334 RepID=UPI0014227642|nr:SusC/RagA family TonB-linked outer membrane protein [Paraflavitalea devenefica]NII26071.1 SusC/RagA family TonB-linked outer membrane protein [Paraflavitalea devenefica]